MKLVAPDASVSPIHPGVFLKDLLEELENSQRRLAQSLAASPMRISRIINGNRSITAELALRLGRYFGQSPRYWLNLQSRYDLDIAEDTSSERVIREVRSLNDVMEIRNEARQAILVQLISLHNYPHAPDTFPPRLIMRSSAWIFCMR